MSDGAALQRLVQDEQDAAEAEDKARHEAMGRGGRVVHCKREPFDVYIGRPSKWGNPIYVKPGYDRAADPERILARYEEYVRSRPDLIAALPELAGKTLGCWCAPRPCHGDVLLRMVAG